LRGAALAVILCILIFALSEVLRYATPGRLLNKVKALHALDNNTVEIAFFGNSHMATGIDSGLFEARTGMEVANMAAATQQVPESALMLKELLRTQRPDIAVLGAFTFLFGSGKNYTANAIPFSLRKIEYALGIKEKKRIKSILFPILQFHNVWSDKKDMELFRNQLTGKPDLSQIKNTFLYTTLSEEAIGQYRYSDEVVEFKDIDYEQAYKYLGSFKETCDRYDVMPVLVMAPWYKGYIERIDYDEISGNIKKGADMFGIPYYDLNMMQGMEWESHFFADEEFNKNQHMNYYGAYTFTSFLIEWLAGLEGSGIEISGDTAEEKDRDLGNYLSGIDGDEPILLVDLCKESIDPGIRSDEIDRQLERLGLSDAADKSSGNALVIFNGPTNNILHEFDDEKDRLEIKEDISGLPQKVEIVYDPDNRTFIKIGERRLNCKPACTNFFIFDSKGNIEDRPVIRWDICDIIVELDQQ